MNRILIFLGLSLCALMCSGIELNQVGSAATNKVMVFVLDAAMVEVSDLPVGEDVWAEIEYRATPDGEALFYEPGERLWWVREKALLILGGTGMPLPREVIRRGSVFVDIAVDGVSLTGGPFEVFPRRDMFAISGSGPDLKAALGKRVIGIDGPYLSQVSNYLALNTPTLEVRGESLNIDFSGIFGTDLLVGGILDATDITCSGFALANAPAAGRVLTSDAGGFGTWQDPSSGISLPVAETFSGTGKAFSLTVTGNASQGGYFEVDNAANSHSALEARSNGTSYAILGYHSGPSGQAGNFNSDHGTNSDACLKAKHDGPGASLFAEKAVGQGSAAVFETTHLANFYPVVRATALGGTWAYEGSNYGPSDGAAKFHLEDVNNYSPCVEVTTNGFGAGIDAKNQGWGPAGKFHNSDTMNMANTVHIENVGEGLALLAKSTGIGGGAKISIDNINSNSDALEVTSNGVGVTLRSKNTGGGHAGWFEIDEANSGVPAIEAVTNGSGWAILGRCTGTGSAADFVSTDPINAAPAVTVGAFGLGAGLAIDHSGAGGHALIATSNDSTNPDPTLKAIAGGGDAARFEGKVTVVGNLAVSGNLAKGSGSFKIDHPLDPENKFLFHSFVESPDMMNVYNSNVVLDENGEAWVDLPEYFEALNRDFRYQLTALGQPGPDLYIATEINGLQFQIAGGAPFQKVSWQVTGIRQDPFASDHPIVTEVEKIEHERGKYLYPKGYGADSSAQIGALDNDAKTVATQD